MPQFSSETINRFQEEAENEFATRVPCILDRTSLAIVSGTSDYDLPETTLSIRRVTYRGFKLDPMTYRDFRDFHASSGRPDFYVFNQTSHLQIKLHPTPNENIAAASANLFGESINDYFIIEFYRIPDYVDYFIPSYIRRRIIKSYVVGMCFALEGEAQNLKASKYHLSKWEYQLGVYSELFEDLHANARRLISDRLADLPNRVPRLRLSQDYGIGVNPGE